MDILREFLETTTIHGLSYISTARSKRAKAAWSLVILVSFCSAAFLISSSYTEWQDDPFSTAITTHSISDLDFPMVTVCPPKDTNTALNHGLMHAGDYLSKTQREQLNNITRRLFILEPFTEFAKTMVDVANPGNLRMICERKQSVPKPFQTEGLEVKLSGRSGKITSPQNISRGVSGNVSNHYILKLNNLRDILGNGTLVIQMEVEEGGYLEYTEGSNFRYYSDLNSWDNAKNACIKTGGHLASINTDAEKEEVFQIVKNTGDTGNFWLGGKMDGEWFWSDGAPWNYQNWNSSQPNYDCVRNCDQGHCLEMQAKEGTWKTQGCSRISRYVCKHPPTNTLLGETNKTLIYMQSNMTFSHLQLVWHLPSHNATSKSGFTMKWQINASLEDSQLISVGDIDNTYLVRMINIARQASILNISSEALKLMILDGKATLVETGQINIKTVCKDERVSNLGGPWWDMKNVLEAVDMSNPNEEFHTNTTDNEMMTGFEIFSLFIHCPKELLLLYQFQMEMLAKKNPRTIIQTTMNNLNSGKIEKDANFVILKQFFMELDKVLKTKLGGIVFALSSELEFKNMIKLDMPYVTDFIRECTKNTSCKSVSNIIHNLGNTKQIFFFFSLFTKKLTVQMEYFRSGSQFCESAPSTPS